MAGRPGVHVRDATVVNGLETLRVKLREQFPGRRTTREGLARELLTDALNDPRTPGRLGIGRRR
jgi:hypothetical protein